MSIINEYFPQISIATFCFSFTALPLNYFMLIVQSGMPWSHVIICMHMYVLNMKMSLCAVIKTLYPCNRIYIMSNVFVSFLLVWRLQQGIFPSGELKDPSTQPHWREALHMPTSWLSESLQQFQRSGQTPAHTLGHCMYGHSLCPSG